MALLLLTATLTGACEARCDLARLGPAMSCHQGAMPGMTMMAGTRATKPSPARMAVDAPPSCLHHGVVPHPALLPGTPPAPLPPVLESLESYLRLPAQPIAGPSLYDAWPQDRSQQTPLARRTTLRL